MESGRLAGRVMGLAVRRVIRTRYLHLHDVHPLFDRRVRMIKDTKCIDHEDVDMKPLRDRFWFAFLQKTQTMVRCLPICKLRYQILTHSLSLLHVFYSHAASRVVLLGCGLTGATTAISFIT
jgi:hypothetical protein